MSIDCMSPLPSLSVEYLQQQRKSQFFMWLLLKYTVLKYCHAEWKMESSYDPYLIIFYQCSVQSSGINLILFWKLQLKNHAKNQVKSNFNLMSDVENQLKSFLGLKLKNISTFLYSLKPLWSQGLLLKVAIGAIPPLNFWGRPILQPLILELLLDYKQICKDWENFHPSNWDFVEVLFTLQIYWLCLVHLLAMLRFQ